MTARSSVAVLLLQHAAVVSGVGFAPKPTMNSPAAPLTPPASSSAAFLEWAEANKIQKLVPLAVQEFDGERGVAAAADVPAGASVLAVPASLAIQTNTLSRPPFWCDESVWRASKWDARLAMLLLREESNFNSNLQPWLKQLPESLATPVLNNPMLKGLKRLEYTPLLDAVASQRAEWDAGCARAPFNPTPEKWDWAMSIVRSRAFSGPYTGGTFIGALAQLFLASTACLGYAVVRGGAGAADQAFDAFLFAFVFIVSNEFVFGPRISKSKRYVLCPWIDFFNHDGALSGSDVAYEYFRDRFAARIDETAGPVPAGQQLMISYGDRSNDVLLQYYGFVQQGNPHEVYALSAEELILGLDAAAGPLPPSALASLKKTPSLAEALLQQPAAFTADGADERAFRLTRLLTSPDGATGGGAEPLADPKAEASVLRALSAVAEARLAALPTEAAKEGGVDSYVAQTLDAFVAEKRRVLRASADALASQAARL